MTMFNLRLFQLQEPGLILPHEKCCFMVEQLGVTNGNVPDRIEMRTSFEEFLAKEAALKKHEGVIYFSRYSYKRT